MTSEKINISQLSEAVNIAFESDEDIVSFYDPNVPVKTIKDVIDNVLVKIQEYYDEVESLEMRGVFVKEALVGYFIFSKGLLVSFGLNKASRDKESDKFWELIKKEIGDAVSCFLWRRNNRAIKWLQKMGMQVKKVNNDIILLECQ